MQRGRKKTLTLLWLVSMIYPERRYGKHYKIDIRQENDENYEKKVRTK